MSHDNVLYCEKSPMSRYIVMRKEPYFSPTYMSTYCENSRVSREKSPISHEKCLKSSEKSPIVDRKEPRSWLKRALRLVTMFYIVKRALSHM